MAITLDAFPEFDPECWRFFQIFTHMILDDESVGHSS